MMVGGALLSYLECTVHQIHNDAVSIYNIAGKLVKRIEYNTRIISVEGLSSGLYFVEIETQGVTRTRKLMIQ